MSDLEEDELKQHKIKLGVNQVSKELDVKCVAWSDGSDFCITELENLA